MGNSKEYRGFESLDTWKQSRELVKFIYSMTKDIKDRSFQDQLQRAALSTMNNIAEGHERGSPKAFARYLKIAKGSCGEVRSLLYAGLDLGYITLSAHRAGLERSMQLSRMIAGLIKSIPA